MRVTTFLTLGAKGVTALVMVGTARLATVGTKLGRLVIAEAALTTFGDT